MFKLCVFVEFFRIKAENQRVALVCDALDISQSVRNGFYFAVLAWQNLVIAVAHTEEIAGACEHYTILGIFCNFAIILFGYGWAIV